jgi:hypothetical protein
MRKEASSSRLSLSIEIQSSSRLHFSMSSLTIMLVLQVFIYLHPITPQNITKLDYGVKLRFSIKC